MFRSRESLRSDPPQRRLVGAAPDDVRGLHVVHRLRDVGALQGDHYDFGNYLSPFYSPELFGDSPHAGSGPKPAAWPPLAAVLAGAADPAVPGWLPLHLLLLPRRLLQGVLGRPAVLRRRRAAQRATAASDSFPLSSRTSTATSCTSRCVFLVLLAHDVVEGALVRRSGDRRTRRSASASARSSCSSTSCCSAATRFGCHSLRHLVGGVLDQLSRAPVRKTALRLRRAASTAGTCCGRGAACSAVGFADLYVRLCSMGVWHDWRIF